MIRRQGKRLGESQNGTGVRGGKENDREIKKKSDGERERVTVEARK